MAGVGWCVCVIFKAFVIETFGISGIWGIMGTG